MRKKVGWILCAALTAPVSYAAEVAYSKKFEDWIATENADPMTDAKRCAAIYTKDRNVIYTEKDAVKIDYKGRGGVSVFRYRFGRAQSSPEESVTDHENNIITVPVFLSESLDMTHLRVQGTTVLRTAINLEISLKGLKAARAAIATRCNMADLPSIKDGVPEWVKWQALPAQSQ
mgnify:CR=1 FL=1